VDNLNRLPEDLVEKIKSKATQALIFCETQVKTIEIWHQLGENGISARPFHSLLTKSLKEEVVDQMQRKEIKAVVSTTALGSSCFNCLKRKKERKKERKINAPL